MLKGDHYCLNKAFKLLFNTLPSLNIPVFLKLENVILTLSFLKFSNIWRKKGCILKRYHVLSMFQENALIKSKIHIQMIH